MEIPIFKWIIWGYIPLFSETPRSKKALDAVEDRNFSLAAFGHHSSIRKRCLGSFGVGPFLGRICKASLFPPLENIPLGLENVDKTSKKPIF